MVLASKVSAIRGPIMLILHSMIRWEPSSNADALNSTIDRLGEQAKLAFLADRRLIASWF
jgi:hypothetical protein